MPRNESKQITIGNDWTQITDGTAGEVVQFYVAVDICRSPTKPAKDAPGLRYEATTLTITAPDIAWIRTAYAGDIATVCIW
ncbi:hypothetical protein HX52_01355 [Salmonella enterica]|nr:hypothetical protein [Salmonella enterica]EBL7696648.1 hypothetical protein [Salmonella enterica]EDU6130329.1 hypothetical protein [Salmonella enterica subsp. enterica]EGF4127696.1 hypothetical protein [Salmonella enterica]HAF2160585.1 hypothetical protein [Salmonella enterica]